ncbi:MAG: cobalamin biosynthesis protein [Pseudomonadota bacterium]
MTSPVPVLVLLSDAPRPLADQVAREIGARIDLRGEGFDEVGSHLRALFAAGHPIIGMCAAGILVRLLAPLVRDKRGEGPVIALAEDGSAVVPLLGGHRGANALARRIAKVLDIAPAITTAGDLALGVALDAPPAGWRLETPRDAKPAMAGLVAGRSATLSGMPEWLEPLLDLATITARPAPDAAAPVVLSVEGCTPLVYRRQTLALGVGCARGCPPEELRGLVYRTLADAGRSPFEIATVHSIDVKADEEAVHALAHELGVPARFFPAERLERETPRLATPSDVVFAEVGCHGVAEGAALAAAGPDGRLAVPKQKTEMATCALAEIGGTPETGSPRGSLAVVGIGPGVADWRTPEASRLIAQAEELVGYGLYIDLLGPISEGKARTAFPLGGEEDRCRHALEAAGEGRRVALICSGDAGIYAMGALVMELLDRPEGAGGVSAAARRVEVINAPGVSALQAASARAGALLGHDFCAISLSDLLTPRDTVLQRIEGAAIGDFVIAFYNPVSMRRRTLLAEARDILLRHRPAETPVLLASSLGRPEEVLRERKLGTLEVDEVDMLTVVLVGSSASRAFGSGDGAAGAGGRWIYTPRGYANKREDIAQ